MEDIELNIIKYALTDDKFYYEEFSGITKLFKKYDYVVEYIKSLEKKLNVAPNLKDFKTGIDLEINIVKKTRLEEFLIDLVGIEPTPEQIKKDVSRLKEIYKFSLYKESIIKVVDLLEKNDLDGVKRNLSELLLSDAELEEKDKIKTDNIFQNPNKIIKQYYETTNNPLQGILTGFKTIDKKLCGIKRKTLNIVAARPGIGKTTFLVNIAYNAWRFGYNVLYFSFEMDLDLIRKFFYCRHSLIPFSQLDKGELSENNFKTLTKTINELNDSNISNNLVVIDIPECSTTNIIRDYIEIFKKNYNIYPDLIVCDYLGIMNPSKTYKEYRLDQGNVALELRALAKIYNLVVWTAVQINRTSVNKAEYGTDSISESDKISQHADYIISLKRPEKLDDDYDNNVIIAQEIKIRTSKPDKFTIYDNRDLKLMTDHEFYDIDELE